MSPHPPQTLDTFHPYYRAVFGFTFLCFFWKNLSFMNLPYYIMLYQNSQKIDFTSWNPILCHFFYKNQGSTLSFFQFFDQNSWLMNFDENVKKTQGNYCVFWKKMTQNGISISKIDFLNYSDKTWFSTINWKKNTFFFKKTQKCESKNGCVAGVIGGKVWNGTVVGVKCVQSLGGGAVTINTQRLFIHL